jgi:hypothetical protein
MPDMLSCPVSFSGRNCLLSIQLRDCCSPGPHLICFSESPARPKVFFSLFFNDHDHLNCFFRVSWVKSAPCPGCLFVRFPSFRFWFRNRKNMFRRYRSSCDFDQPISEFLVQNDENSFTHLAHLKCIIHMFHYSSRQIMF